MRALLVITAKDLRLLLRDRAALIFLTIAPIVVITVAGFSLANLYGADPTGQTAYEVLLADEDGGTLAEQLHTRLASERSLRLRRVATRAEAEALIRAKHTGSGIVIPRGTQSALDAGDAASVILLSDSVKYLERINVRTRLLELRDTLSQEQQDRLATLAADEHRRLRDELERMRQELETRSAELRQRWHDAESTRKAALERSRAVLHQLQRETKDAIIKQLDSVGETARRELHAQLDAQLAPLRAFADTLRQREAAFNAWIAELERLAGNRADSIPAPPAFPQPPPALESLLDRGPSVRLPAPQPVLDLPPAPRIELPPLPAPPHIEVPKVSLPDPPRPPRLLAITEVDVSGGTGTINTFDQNVPGFGVTFLLLGMLLGISLGLLDERDWGTFERLRAMPVAMRQVLMGKLLSRFAVGVLQMVVLLAVGRIAFGVSLGPQPWALLLPIVGIVFAGTTFGLVVAAVAPSREAVLPVGSIVIVTMAAVGGCWWPIDLEPRWMRTVALAFPTTWAMDAFNDLMIRHRSARAALLPTAVMLSYGTVYLLCGLALFHRFGERRS
jgi:ABC-type multidrug transport system permease subunit